VTEADAFESLFERHHRAVLAYALRRVPTAVDAEDAVSETFAVAWRRFDRAPEAEAALPWLLAIARRVLANQHRSTDRRFRLGIRLRANARDTTTTYDADTPALEALDRLRADDRELLRLLAWEGLSQAEAGSVLGISENAVAIRLHRARKRFAEELGRVKGFESGRTSSQAEGRMPGQRTPEGHAP
jgi:RNA polymerase sigma-70 factor (ECF subfamily)